MSGKLIISVGILGFVLLCVACVLSHARVIERDLWSRSNVALATAGISDVGVTFAGRDATLAGTVDSQKLRLRAEQAVAKERGVRVVDNRIRVAETTALAPPKVDEPPQEFLLELERELNKVLAGKTIDFDSGSAVIGSQGRLILDQLAPLIAAHSGVIIEIGGHTDSRGNDEANLALSTRRAAAVKRYLVEHGVDGSRLTTIGYGETKPVADNKTEAGRRLNRRITFVVLGRS